MDLTPYHAKYYGCDLTKRCPSDSMEKLAGAVASAQVDLNPHQVDAALSHSTRRCHEEEQLVAAERFKAQQRVEAEKGEGEAKPARAEKEALANQKLAASLTPLLVQQSMIDKLSAKIQLMVVPQGQNFLMQLPQTGGK